MKIVGTICEYNPFHNGHLYQLKKIKEISKCDCLIVVMSTYFTMRGELSVHNPKEKTRYALSEADIVVALPSTLAVNSADKFSYYAVRELNKLGVSEIYFGSEANDISIYDDVYNKLNNLDIKDYLNSGMSYKKATNLDLLPNDLLGFSYYKAVRDNNYNIKCIPLKRIGSKHGEDKPADDTYTSSSSIRLNPNLVDNYSPDFVKKDFYDYEKLFKYFKYFIIVNKNYNNMRFIDEGIENLIIKHTLTSNNFNELINKCSNKRYTNSRIRRAIFHILINDIKIDDNYIYSYILGYSSNGRKYLSSIKKDINIITNNKNNICNILDNEILLARILDMIFNDNILDNELSKPIEKAE